MLLVCTACWFARWGIFDRHARTVMVLWSLVVFPSLLVALLHSRWIRRAMMCKPFMQLGGISFALYLTHVPVFYMLVLVIPKEVLNANEGLGIFVVTSLFVATVAANFFERPVRRRLDGLLKDNSKTCNQTGTYPSSMLPEAK
jgi:peptidoglycan/LPS O-acetylase OafA/YrhL